MAKLTARQRRSLEHRKLVVRRAEERGATADKVLDVYTRTRGGGIEEILRLWVTTPDRPGSGRDAYTLLSHFGIPPKVGNGSIQRLMAPTAAAVRALSRYNKGKTSESQQRRAALPKRWKATVTPAPTRLSAWELVRQLVRRPFLRGALLLVPVSVVAAVAVVT